jgi:hypothetical protein
VPPVALEPGFFKGRQRYVVRQGSKRFNSLLRDGVVRFRCQEDCDWLGLRREDQVDIGCGEIKFYKNCVEMCEDLGDDLMPSYTDLKGTLREFGQQQAAIQCHHLFPFTASKPWPRTDDIEGVSALEVLVSRRESVAFLGPDRPRRSRGAKKGDVRRVADSSPPEKRAKADIAGRKRKVAPADSFSMEHSCLQHVCRPPTDSDVLLVVDAAAKFTNIRKLAGGQLAKVLKPVLRTVCDEEEVSASKCVQRNRGEALRLLEWILDVHARAIALKS